MNEQTMDPDWLEFHPDPKKPDFQVAYLATNKAGAIGAYSIHNGFTYTQYRNRTVQNVAATSQF